jgi:hypothetical protein
LIQSHKKMLLSLLVVAVVDPMTPQEVVLVVE